MVRTLLKKYFIGARATQIKSSRINEYLWEEPFTNDSYFRVNSAMITDGFSVSDFVSDLEEAIATRRLVLPHVSWHRERLGYYRQSAFYFPHG
jgi:hypothetical protein